MIALYIILGVLLFLFLLTLCPVGFEVSFRQEFSLTLRYLFLTFHLLPGKEKEEEPKEREEPEKEKKPGAGLETLKALFRQEGFSGFLKALFDLVKLASGASKKLLSHIKVKNFDLYLCLAGAEDAAAAAIQYGQVSAAVYSACGFLLGLTGCRRRAVTVDLDYQAEENTVDFSARLSLRPLHAIKAALSLLAGSIPFLRKVLRAGSAGKNDKQSERVPQKRKQGDQS